MNKPNSLTRFLKVYMIIGCMLILQQANATKEPVYIRGRFSYSKCNETEKGVSCEKLEITKQRQETASLWPPGPYAIRMTRNRCPEWQSRGWRKGILILKADTADIPLKLYFCAKLRDSYKLDRGKWIPGEYRIYRLGEFCPEGFNEVNQTWTNGFKNVDLAYFGHVPQFEVYNTSGSISILFYMCQRNSSTSIDASNFGMLKTEFVLGKTEHGDCPKQTNASVNQISLGNGGGNSSCLYTPHEEEPNRLSICSKSFELISDINMSKGIFAKSDPIFNYMLSEGIVLESELNADGKEYVWYQFDMQRTLSVVKIVINATSNNEQIWTAQVKNISCFYDNIMWSFMYGEAANCWYNASFISTRSLALHIRKIHTRFITLILAETSGYPAIKHEGSIQMFISDFPEQCNEDIGMEDGSIQDLQLTASSSLTLHLPSAARPFGTGWCAAFSDTKPWILVDLVAVTVFEGISIWNIDKNEIRSTGNDERCFPFCLYYGIDHDALLMYKDMNFEMKRSTPKRDVWTVIFINPTKSRYVKLEIQQRNENDSGCLKFELHGCKLSGIPTLKCYNGSQMFESEAAVLPEDRLLKTFESKTSKNCQHQCLETENCSVAIFEGRDCMHYPASHYGMWDIRKKRNENWFLKLCANEPVELFPSLKSADGSRRTNVEIVEENAIITSVGYPFTFGTGQTYRWIIQFSDHRYVRIVFTNISLSQVHEECNDSLLMSKGIENVNKGIQIDHEYNGRVFVVETDTSLVIISFTSCPTRRKVVYSGVRAVITAEEIPACFPKWSRTISGKKSDGICNKTEMFLTSKSFLNHPFDNKREKWEIQAAEHHTVKLNVISFYVVCSHDEKRKPSTFTVVDTSEKKIYCNTDLPPDVIYSKTSLVQVEFRKRHTKTMFIRKEGFRLRYATITDPFQNIVYSKKSATEVCSETFGKCYHLFRGEETWSAAYGFCRKCNLKIVSITTKYELNFVHSQLIKRISRDRKVVSKYRHDTLALNAHFGLRRQMIKDGRSKFIWENGSPVTYSAWGKGYPRAGENCTQIYTQLLPNESLLSESCTSDTAMYFVCQSPHFGEENEQKTDEQEQCTCQEGWIQHSSNCYGVQPAGNWFHAQMHCTRFQSQLVELTDTFEKVFVTALAERSGDIWIDLTDFRGTFIWNTSGNALPDYFEKMFLISYKYDGHCVKMTKQNPWLLTNCSSSIKFVCEKEIAPEVQCVTIEDESQTSNITLTGNECRAWGALRRNQENNLKTRFSNFEIEYYYNDYNNCIDPANSGISWCYTDERSASIWEPCLMKMPNTGEGYQNYESSNEFQCKDGREVPISFRCNGVLDCMDFSDEVFCYTKPQYLTNNKSRSPTGYAHKRFENATHHLCGSEEWISVLSKCDNIIDCADASDEIYCSETDKDLNTDNTDNTSCDGVRCSIDVCDFTSGHQTVEQELRELRECTFEEFSCTDQLCIPLGSKCDGNSDCFDMSDENQCDSCTSSFHCDHVKCIPLRRKCDRYVDCEDGSDETLCSYAPPSSCDQLWKQGFHTSRRYNLDGFIFYCDFSAMSTSTRTIMMSIKNIDVDMKLGHIYTQSKEHGVLQIKEREFQEVAYIDDYSCFLEIKSECQIRYAIPKYSAAFYKCQCIVETFTIARDPYEQEYEYADGRFKYTLYQSTPCDDSMRWRDLANTSKYYNVTSDGDIYIDDRLLNGDLPIDISLEINCFFDNTTDVKGNCKLCIYDGDDLGLLCRCREDLLENCADFSCPENTVKCPSSYCIQLGLVCNEVPDCPYGEDELECTCSNTTREIYIITEEPTDQRLTESNTAVVGLAKQFYNIDNDIRILYFTSNTYQELSFEHRVLDIREIGFQPEKEYVQTPDCQYQTMARNLLTNILTNASVSIGIIFIEDTAESSKVAELMFLNISIAAVPIYRVFKNMHLQIPNNKSNTYSSVQDVRIDRWSVLYSLGYRRFQGICIDLTEVPCQGGYRCSASKQCIPLEQVCDGIPQCLGKDDEKLCGLFCPDHCTCVGYSIFCRESQLTSKDVQLMSSSLRSADLSVNPGIRDVVKKKKLRFPFMTRLNMSYCGIRTINEGGLFYLNNLRCLDLRYNRIEVLPNNVFRHLGKLVSLNLDGNFELRLIVSTAFNGLTNLRSLRITGTNLRQISTNTFNGLFLQIIDISYNEIDEIENYAFNNTSVDEIDFRGNSILNFNKNIFAGIRSLNKLRSTAFKFCCIRPCYVAESDCYPKRDEFSSCEDLMRHPILQAVLWIIGIIGFLGNLSSIIYRLIYDRERFKIGYGIFVTNLAVADLLMGIYLITIAVADSIFRNRYIFMDEKWRKSIWCVTAGVISTVSSEASVLFVCLITLDRLLVIKYPFGTVRITASKAHIASVFCWMLAFTLALIPVVYTDYFQNQFYSRSGVCVALPLTKDKPPGWQYSVSIFVGLNFCTFVLVALGQCSIFVELRNVTGRIQKKNTSRKRDLRVARNLILVATTDFLCWFPIGVMGIMALYGHTISGDVYAWTAVFILPLNSGLNPILYTLSAILGKEKFNPSTEEQNRLENQKEIGLGIIRFHALHSIKIKKSVKEGKSVYDMMNEDEHISTSIAIATSMLLSRYLRLLHESSVILEQLSPETTYIKINDKKILKISIVLIAKLSSTSDERKMQDDMYQFGIILRRLLAMRT